MVRALIFVAAWFICWTYVYGSARALNYDSVSFFVDSYDNTTYSIFIRDLRKALAKNSDSYESIPVLPSAFQVDPDERFVLATLRDTGHNLTLALDVTNAKIVGFSVESYYSYFFNDVGDDVYESPLFDHTKKTKLQFGGSYESLENQGAYRLNTTLGIKQLNQSCLQLYDFRSQSTMNFAPSLLVVIQMVSEAARITLVEEEILANFKDGFVPKCDIVSLESGGRGLSLEILLSENGVFRLPFMLKDADCKLYFVTKNHQIISKMGLLSGILAYSAAMFI